MDNKICKIHNEPVLFGEKNAQQRLQFLCRFCIQQRLQIQNIEEIDNEQKQLLQSLEQTYDQNIKQLKSFSETLEQYTIQIQQKLKKLKQQVDQFISHIFERKKQVQNTSNNFTNLQQTQIIQEESIINNNITQIKEQLINQLKDIEISTKLDQLYSSLENKQINVSNEGNDKRDVVVEKITEIDPQIAVNDQKIEILQKQFDYQLIQNLSYEQYENCCAIAFNIDSTIMIAGCSNLIKVFQLKDNKLIEVQQLEGHSSDVSCLKFMKKSNQFISASLDSTIIIWEKNQNNQWESNQVLKGHRFYIYSITINKNEDMLISGSQDRTIKVWNKQNNIWTLNQSIDCQSYVISISLSNQEDQLIASVRNYQILILQLQCTYWVIKQKISVEKYGWRLWYINQNQFVFQSFDENNLQIFDYDPNGQNFKKGQELQYLNEVSDNQGFFPICYISKIGLIMVKNGQYVHLIRRNQNGQFSVEQSINFNTNCLYGGITDDGRFIATWDNNSKEIQIRKLHY